MDEEVLARNQVPVPAVDRSKELGSSGNSNTIGKSTGRTHFSSYQNLVDITANEVAAHESGDKTLQTCRLCAQIGTGHVPIFAENNSAVAEKISRCLPILVRN